MAAVNSAVQPVLSQDYLNIDTTAAEAGFGPARTPGPDTDTTPVVPTALSPLEPGQPVRVPAAEGYQYDAEGEGPYPCLPDGGLVPQPPVQRQQGGVPQGGLESLLAPNRFPGQWNASKDYAGYDKLSQAVDTAGWMQNVPTGRDASRLTFGQANPGNNPTWYGFGERPVQPHFAVAATDYTPGTVEGVPGITDGSLPDWSMTGGQGNTAYNTPGPPPASEADSSGGLIDMSWY